MAEIKKEPATFEDTGGQELVVFDEGHSHADILRYVVKDVGMEETQQILDIIKQEG